MRPGGCLLNQLFHSLLSEPVSQPWILSPLVLSGTLSLRHWVGAHGMRAADLTAWTQPPYSLTSVQVPVAPPSQDQVPLLETLDFCLRRVPLCVYSRPVWFTTYSAQLYLGVSGSGPCLHCIYLSSYLMLVTSIERQVCFRLMAPEG